MRTFGEVFLFSCTVMLLLISIKSMTIYRTSVILCLTVVKNDQLLGMMK